MCLVVPWNLSARAPQLDGSKAVKGHNGPTRAAWCLPWASKRAWDRAGLWGLSPHTAQGSPVTTALQQLLSAKSWELHPHSHDSTRSQLSISQGSSRGNHSQHNWGHFWERTAPAARAGGVPHSWRGRQKCQEPILIPRAPESQSQADCSLLPCSWAPAAFAPYVPCVPWAVPLHSSLCCFPRKEWLCAQEQGSGFGYHCRGKGGKGCRCPLLLAASLTPFLPTFPVSHSCCPQPHCCPFHVVRKCFHGDAVQQVGVPQPVYGAVPLLSDIFGASCGLLADIKQSQLSHTSQVLQRGHILGTFPAFPMDLTLL